MNREAQDLWDRATESLAAAITAAEQVLGAVRADMDGGHHPRGGTGVGGGDQ